MSDIDQKTGPYQLILITGPSGAGRSTAIRALEDLGYEAIDNLPLSLLPRLLDGTRPEKPLALGIDVRNRDFSANSLIETIVRLHRDEDPVQVLYLDCATDVLMRRFSETRRRHPLAQAETPQVGIERENDLLIPIQARADILIDTSDLTPHDLRAELARWFSPQDHQNLSVSVQSFSYKRGLPRGLDMVMDCRFLENPYWQEDLRDMTGRDAAVQEYVRKDPNFAAFHSKLNDMVQLLLPAYQAEGKSYLAIGFGCTGGQHRSVTMAETLGKTLADAGWQVSIRHRELERRI